MIKAEIGLQQHTKIPKHTPNKGYNYCVKIIHYIFIFFMSARSNGHNFKKYHHADFPKRQIGFNLTVLYEWHKNESII